MPQLTRSSAFAPKQSFAFLLTRRTWTISWNKTPAPFGLVFLKTLQSDSQAATVDQLSVIDFPRIAGHKPFDITQQWFIDMCQDIGMSAPTPASH